MRDCGDWGSTEHGGCAMKTLEKMHRWEGGKSEASLADIMLYYTTRQDQYLQLTMAFATPINNWQMYLRLLYWAEAKYEADEIGRKFGLN